MKFRPVQYKFIRQENRLKSSFFLLEGAVNEELIKAKPHDHLIDLLDYCSNIGGVNKRIYVKKPNGLKFMSMTDMMNYNSSESCKNVSATIGINTLKHKFKRGMILASVVGGIGDVAMVDKWSQDAVTGNNIIKLYSQKEEINSLLYAYLKSTYGNSIILKLGGGAVQSYIDPELFKKIPIPKFKEDFIFKINDLIQQSLICRESSIEELINTQKLLNDHLQIKNFTYEDFEYYGPRTYSRKVRVFKINIQNFNLNSFKAFNYSETLAKRVSDLKEKHKVLPLIDVIDTKGLYHSSAFKRVEVSSGHGVELINQKQIFNNIIKGKYVSKLYPKKSDYAVTNEILISGVGSMGEGDAYCRAVLVENFLRSKLLVGEFIRMKAKDIPTGYLYAWLSSPLAYRLIRSYSCGATLCRPIPYFLERLPIPILDKVLMDNINDRIINIHNQKSRSVDLEQQAIDLIEKEIESWQK
ncbi:hypothetical protein [Aestuariivivens sediminis]|uniref:hypothetical protein n=1 Tax=Aestuariivivens sediminis TaxID=2913557 RepID=UPI001F57AC9A|nr:hypothetical protein [Aestuariivivens sediminis]